MLTVQFLSERVGAVQHHVSLGVDRLQLLQSGFSAPNALQKNREIMKPRFFEVIDGRRES